MISQGHRKGVDCPFARGQPLHTLLQDQTFVRHLFQKLQKDEVYSLLCDMLI